MPESFEKPLERLKKQEFDVVRTEIERRSLTEGQHRWAKVSQGPFPEHITKHIFICGLHRSGTTLIHDSLSSLYNLSYLKGPVPESEGQHLQDVIASDTAFGGVGKFAFAAEMNTPPPESLSGSAHTRQRIMCQWAPWIVGASEFLIEKSPPNILRIPFLRAVFPGAKFLLWTRHPKAVSVASRKWSNSSDSALMLHWNVAHSIAIQSLEQDCIVARYEDFCKNPKSEIERIAMFFGLQKRKEPLALRESFAALTNSNPKYLKQFSAPNSTGARISKLFGY